LRQRGFAIEPFQDVTNDRRRVRFQERFDRVWFIHFAGEEMFGRNRGQIFRGIAELHRMFRFGFEIDHDLVEQQVPLRHLTEPPAFVQTKRARAQLL